MIVGHGGVKSSVRLVASEKVGLVDALSYRHYSESVNKK
jgi:hypothetical protein